MATPIEVYGLPNCDSCRKVQARLRHLQLAFRFIDYRERPLSAAQLRDWGAQIGWERLVNKASTTWRTVPSERRQPETPEDWLNLALEFPTLVKRPLVVREGRATIGLE